MPNITDSVPEKRNALARLSRPSVFACKPSSEDRQEESTTRSAFSLSPNTSPSSRNPSFSLSPYREKENENGNGWDDDIIAIYKWCGRWDNDITTICQWCGQRFPVSNKILDVIKTEPKQFQLVLYTIFKLSEQKKNDPFFTGDVYHLYQDICKDIKSEILTQRRVSDLISELDMLGIIHGKVISKGRYGRTREMYSNIPSSLLEKVKEVLEKELV